MIGKVVGNYRVTERIGEGGMGAVYKGVDLMLEREVAIKALRPELARQPELLARFRTEAVTLAKLSHPNIATLYSFFCQDDEFYMVLEFVRGETLDTIIQSSGSMTSDKVIPIFSQALAGIEQAHNLGIIHRDIKPANIMVTPTGMVKVMDFGIARVLGSNRLTRTGYAIGTLQYMSPEQIRGEETDTRADIYSLGALLYEMLTGNVPFNAQTEYDLMKAQVEQTPIPPSKLAPHIPRKVEEVVMRSLAKAPIYRFQTVAEFHHALTAAAPLGVGATSQASSTTVYAAPITRGDHPVKSPTDPNAATDWQFKKMAGNNQTSISAEPLGTVPLGRQPQSAEQPLQQTVRIDESLPHLASFQQTGATMVDQGDTDKYSAQIPVEPAVPSTVRFDSESTQPAPSEQKTANEEVIAPTSAPMQVSPVGAEILSTGQFGQTGEFQKQTTSPQPLPKSSGLKALAAVFVVIFILAGVGVTYLFFIRKPGQTSTPENKPPAQATVESGKPSPAPTETPAQPPATQLPSQPDTAANPAASTNEAKPDAGKPATGKKKELTAEEKAAAKKKKTLDALDH